MLCAGGCPLSPAAPPLPPPLSLPLFSWGGGWGLAARAAPPAPPPPPTAGDWPAPAVIRLAIPGGRAGLHTILLGPRADGRPHDPRSVAQLEETAGLVAAAVAAGHAPTPEARG